VCGGGGGSKPPLVFVHYVLLYLNVTHSSLALFEKKFRYTIYFIFCLCKQCVSALLFLPMLTRHFFGGYISYKVFIVVC
jgi:hypothetical protein